MLSSVSRPVAAVGCAMALAAALAACGSSSPSSQSRKTANAAPAQTASFVSASQQACLKRLPGYQALSIDDATAPRLGETQVAAVHLSYPAAPPLPASQPVLYAMIEDPTYGTNQVDSWEQEAGQSREELTC